MQPFLLRLPRFWMLSSQSLDPSLGNFVAFHTITDTHIGYTSF